MNSAYCLRMGEYLFYRSSQMLHCLYMCLVRKSAVISVQYFPVYNAEVNRKSLFLCLQASVVWGVLLNCFPPPNLNF